MLLATWEINETLKIQECDASGTLRLSELDGQHVFFAEDDIDDMIDALERAKSYLAYKSKEEADREALARWGKAKIPGGEVRWGGER